MSAMVRRARCAGHEVGGEGGGGRVVGTRGRGRGGGGKEGMRVVSKETLTTEEKNGVAG